MKTFYTLLLGLALSLLANSQNLVSNPGFEELLNDQVTPTQWSTEIISVSGIAPMTAENNDVHGGLHAIKISSIAAQTVALRSQNMSNSLAFSGATFNLSFWYKDDGNAKTKFKLRWSNSSTEITTDPFEGEYLPNTTGWQHITASGIAPPNTNRVRILLLVTGDGDNASGSILFDDVSLTTGVLGVNQNEIPGLQIYPNPVTNGTLFIETSANAEKTVAAFDLSGKQVISTKMEGNSLNVSSIKSGVYILKVIEENKISTSKLIIR